MTIDEMIEALETAKEIMGGDAIVQLASQNYRSQMRYGIHEVAVGVTRDGEDEDIIDLVKGEVWIVEGAQDHERPYSVPELADVFDCC